MSQETIIKKDKPSSVLRVERASRLKELRKITRLSRQKFAKKHKLPYGSLQNWEDAKYGGLTKTGAPRVIEALKKEGIFVSLQWLLEGAGPQPYISAPILLKRMQIEINKSMDSNYKSPAQDDEALIIEEELNLYRHYHPNALSAVVADDAMQPSLFKGDYVAGEQYAQNSLDALCGKVCIITTKDKQVLVRKLAKGTKPGLYNLLCTNPASKALTQENVQVANAAPVVWLRRAPAMDAR